MRLNQQTILITSNEQWGDIWFSKQNYAYELSKNNTVFFLNPPVHWRFRNLFYNPIQSKKYNENLEIITYQNFLPIINKSVNLFNNFLVSFYLKYYFNKRKITRYIFWAFDPVRLYNPRLLKPFLSIYHCVDLFFFKYIGESILCKKSNFIIANSTILLNEYIHFNKPMQLIPHAISTEEFEVSALDAEQIDIPYEQYGLYIGVIDERIDFAWVEKAIILHPLQYFVFVGPLNYPESNAAAVRLFGKEKIYLNILSIGPRHFKTLKNYVNKAKFCISFMDKNYPGNTIAHHKTLVYLAQGKPIFGYKFTEYEQLQDIMYMSDKYDEVLEMLNNFLINGEDNELINKRILYAKQFTFEATFEKIELLINDRINP